MPIVAHSDLPVFAELAASGHPVLGLEEARSQDIRELHVGLLNMMPDAALQVTEHQFLRLVGSANPIVQLYVHPFTVPGLVRDDPARAHIASHYESFDRLADEGLDALVVTGANVSNPRLPDEAFWEPLGEVMDWAVDHVTSVLCSCLATHALLERSHGIERHRMATKRWGVFPHRVVAPDHPLLAGTNTRFDVPHSRWNEVTSRQVRDAGMQVLVESVEGDFHMGTSADGIRTVWLQGHPEYDRVSLLKEFKREVDRYVMGDLDQLPPYPDHYLSASAARVARAHLDDVAVARERGTAPPPFPEERLSADLDNTWTDTGKAVFTNWLGLVYRLTDLRRGVPFMDGVDPDDPLGRRDHPP
ncbi:homoserine O-succinyltransferase MetA [Salsipaludibacter albus]|uniref:homoserine O-succinyltransferase MetA n=1 Tax=Salsipaludibacter albus TaxID=2849650 RepID=UPI001EE3F670|nr:homoserine O-succinyltransferase [Salsipaludibacter albus]